LNLIIKIQKTAEREKTLGLTAVNFHPKLPEDLRQLSLNQG
jgi:hypothetical protein